MLDLTVKIERPYFFCESIPAAGGVCELSSAESRHLTRALRIAEDEHVMLVDGAGTRAEAEIKQQECGRKGDKVCCVVRQRQCLAPPCPAIHLLVALPRSNRADNIFRQATELGVWEISPLICSRSVSRPDSSRSKPRWRNEMIAAMKQSGNPYLPRIAPPASFDDALARTEGNGFVGDQGGSLQRGIVSPNRGRVELWIGPEGGFATTEKKELFHKGLQSVRIGPWTLRVDTAVTALLGWLNEKVNTDDSCAQC